MNPRVAIVRAPPRTSTSTRHALNARVTRDEAAAPRRVVIAVRKITPAATRLRHPTKVTRASRTVRIFATQRSWRVATSTYVTHAFNAFTASLWLRISTKLWIAISRLFSRVVASRVCIITRNHPSSTYFARLLRRITR